MADPYLTYLGPSNVRILNTVLVNLSQDKEDTTDDPSGVVLVTRQGPVVECVYFCGEFLPPYSGIAIQAPAEGVANLHFQIRREGGWIEPPSFAGVAWSFDV